MAQTAEVGGVNLKIGKSPTIMAIARTRCEPCSIRMGWVVGQAAIKTGRTPPTQPPDLELPKHQGPRPYEEVVVCIQDWHAWRFH